MLPSPTGYRLMSFGFPFFNKMMVVLIRKISGKRATNHVLAGLFFGINDLRVRGCMKGTKPAPCSIHSTGPSSTIGVNNTFSLKSDLHEISTSLD